MCSQTRIKFLITRRHFSVWPDIQLSVRGYIPAVRDHLPPSNSHLCCLLSLCGATSVRGEEQGSRGAGEQDGEGDVEEVEPGVEGEQLAAGAQRMIGLLREVGAVLLNLHHLLLLLRVSRGVLFLFSSEQLILLVISKLSAHIRLVVNSCSHFSMSLRCEGLEWNDVQYQISLDI